MKTCPSCGAQCPPDDLFCEADGTRLDSINDGTPPAPPASGPVSNLLCLHCGTTDCNDGDGYCVDCGSKLVSNSPSPLTRAKPQIELAYRARGSDYCEQESKDIAAASDRGLVHTENEDAFAYRTVNIGTIPCHAICVCDGVSSSSFASRASRLACETIVTSVLLEAESSGVSIDSLMPEALRKSVLDAHRALCQEIPSVRGREPAGSTVVAAIIFERSVWVAWSGDSRAYWLSNKPIQHQSRLLTRDHSWANEALDRNEITEEEARSHRLAHAITRCIGPLETHDLSGGLGPDVVQFTVSEPGTLLLCSDGLWNYFDSLESLEEQAFSSIPRESGTATHSLTTDVSIETETSLKLPKPKHRLLSSVRQLVSYALDCGGRDNITVVMVDIS